MIPLCHFLKKWIIEICLSISQLCVIWKPFPEIITNRVSATLDSNQQRGQAGFRSGFLQQHIHFMNQAFDTSAEYKSLQCMTFIDRVKASGSVETSVNVQATRRQGFGEPHMYVLEDVTIERREKKRTKFHLERAPGKWPLSRIVQGLIKRRLKLNWEHRSKNCQWKL